MDLLDFSDLFLKPLVRAVSPVSPDEKPGETTEPNQKSSNDAGFGDLSHLSHLSHRKRDKAGCNERPPASQDNATCTGQQDNEDASPYRIALDGHAQLIWLESGLFVHDVVTRARALYGAERVADSGLAPSGGWPKLSDIPELPPSDGPPMPDASCACGGRHYWLAEDGWRCSDCHPRPKPWAHTTCVVPGPATPRAPTIARATVEALHPATIAGIPLGVVLDHAGPEDYVDLPDLDVIEAFARSLAATGTIRPQDLARTETATGHADRPLVCCGDCQHFQPDSLGNGSGIGRCAVSAWRQGQPPLYPRAPRRCTSHERERQDRAFHPTNHWRHEHELC